MRDPEKEKDTHTPSPSYTHHPSTPLYSKTCQQMAKVARNLHNAGLISTRAATAATVAQAETEVVRKSVEINFKGKLVTTCTTKHTHTPRRTDTITLAQWTKVKLIAMLIIPSTDCNCAVGSFCV